MSSIVTPLPKAWLGYGLPRREASRACIRVCPYCHDRKAAEQEARRVNHDVRYQACPSCVNARNAERMGETP